MLGMLDFSPRKDSQGNLRAANSVARRSMVPCIYLSGDIKLAFKSFFQVRVKYLGSELIILPSAQVPRVYSWIGFAGEV